MPVIPCNVGKNPVRPATRRIHGAASFLLGRI
jgi:hypothetical protein